MARSHCPRSISPQRPQPWIREIIRCVWNHEHHYLIHDTGGDARLIRRMMKCAKFDRPTLPDPVTVYRGISRVGLKKGSRGLSWTLSRDVACWFAYRRDFPKPLVIRASVSPSEIILWDNDRSEEEVILARTPVAVVGPDPLTRQRGTKVRSTR
jgi:hypothetical protein